ncbi:MAG: N-acetyltransferase family protein [Terracidiphilus sp.]
MQIRDAFQPDFEEITAIYNDVLTHSTAIYNDRPASVADRVAWWRSRLEQHYPVARGNRRRARVRIRQLRRFSILARLPTLKCLATQEKLPGKTILIVDVSGSMYSGQIRYTVEGTVHIASSLRGQGVGSLLLKALIVHAQEAGKHSMIAGVDSENAASLRFLDRFGFERVGHLREVGYKFDRFLDLVLLQCWITPRVGHD